MPHQKQAVEGSRVSHQKQAVEGSRMPHQKQAIEGSRVSHQKQAVEGSRRSLHQASSGYYVIIWSMQNYTQVATLTGHTDVVTATAFSPNGTQMTSSSDDGSIRVWTVPTWRLAALLTGQLLVTDVAWAGDGITLASSSGSTADM
jgi:WD40 repeat protein